MKVKLSMALFTASIALYSCGPQGEQPTSTPIDSTNIKGTAPADYNKTDNPNEEMLPEEETGGNRANTPGGDSIPSTRNQGQSK